MERDLDAEANAILARHVEYMGWPQSGQIMTRTHNALAAIKEALAARPIADLGEDGELERKLRRTSVEAVGHPDSPGGRDTRAVLVNPDGREAADRLILYREALDRLVDAATTIAGRLDMLNRETEIGVAIKEARAVLLRTPRP